MTLSPDERNAVVNYRVEKAKDTIREVENIAGLGYWNNVANRLYYSAYYVISALLIKKGYAANTHSGVKNLFALHFVKTGKISKEYMQLYSSLFDFRLKSDYDDFFDVDEKDIRPLIEPVKMLIHEIERLIDEKI